MAEIFDWVKPSVLWQENGQDYRQTDFYRPSVLKFESDDFMDEFFAAARAPQPVAFQQALAVAQTPDLPLKLFQPIHGHFYLVCGTLSCRTPGLPDRVVRTQDGEDVFFVLRKVVSGVEYGWLASGAQTGWQPLGGDPRRVLDGEERQPLCTTPAANGRSLFFGYVPVASRDTYSVPPQQLAVPNQLTDPRLEELGARFIDPIEKMNIFTNVPDLIVLSLSVYLLLDLWEYLYTYLPDVAVALRDNSDATFTGGQALAQLDLMRFLKAQHLNGSVFLATALGKAATNRATLNQAGGVPPGQLPQLGFNASYSLENVTVDTNALGQKVQAALPQELPPIQLPKLDNQAATRYVLRCVYERPQCEPPIRVVSLPSQPFTLAPFFDPDAPVRTVRIPLPTDVSIAALRKFKKGVSFMMSDAMRKKLTSLQGHEKDLITKDPPGALTEPSDEFAFICSFSIQIIFIVAFVLLIMFVIILNFVFWWIAFFKICLPIPKSWLPE